MEKVNKNQKRKFRRRYFSMMEMLIVIAIIALLAGIGVPAYMNHLENAKRTQARSQIANFGIAINSFYLDTKKFPKQLSDLISDPGVKRWRGPYLDQMSSIPEDPWGSEYNYSQPGSDGRDFDISSYAKDRTQGGQTWKDKDICSWKRDDD